MREHRQYMHKLVSISRYMCDRLSTVADALWLHVCLSVCLSFSAHWGCCCSQCAPFPQCSHTCRLRPLVVSHSQSALHAFTSDNLVRRACFTLYSLCCLSHCTVCLFSSYFLFPTETDLLFKQISGFSEVLYDAILAHTHTHSCLHHYMASTGRKNIVINVLCWLSQQ